jgi:hypothetical protein
MTLELRVGPPVTLAPGGSEDFVISELKYGTRNLDRWLITRPGDFQISATFSTKAMKHKAGETPSLNQDPRFFDFSLKSYVIITTSTSNLVVLKVTE